MATGTFTYNALHMKTLKKRNAVSIGAIAVNHIFLYAHWA